MLSYKAIVLSIFMSTAAMSTNVDRSDASLTLGQVMRSMKRDPTGEGFFHVGDDGVLRTLTANKTVVDYRQLTPAQIAQKLAVYSGDTKTYLENLFEGVDGRDVMDPQSLWTLSPQLMPSENPTLKAVMGTTPAIDSASRLFKRQCNTVDCAADSTCARFGCASCLRPDVVVEGICEDPS
ncbi:hypothetical protein SCHPADRAFT_426212 [Schizopora paradoxa]|uniref:Uncharacterized protein n=1 Tax=Schizopora paradoxa TaxID=27342 RepID=A0A0H2RL14_9AGAM|nr:hypothetical protein SCHPADRAFT_426212 [Schizopora paradoxa]